MIDNLTITFESNGITHTLDVPTRDENLPYNLATAFTEIIKQSDANDEMVIDNLKDEFAYGTNSWISVNDRLPEMDRDVIGICLHGIKLILFLHVETNTLLIPSIVCSSEKREYRYTAMFSQKERISLHL